MEDLKDKTETSTEEVTKVELTTSQKLTKALGVAESLGLGATASVHSLGNGESFQRSDYEGYSGSNGVRNVEWSRARGEGEGSSKYKFMESRHDSHATLIKEAEPKNTRAGWGGVVTPAPKAGNVVGVTRTDSNGNEFNVKLTGDRAKRAAEIVRGRATRGVSRSVTEKLDEHRREIEEIAA